MAKDAVAATNHRLFHRLAGGRGGRFHNKTLHSIFGKLTWEEADTLQELLKHLEDGATYFGPVFAGTVTKTDDGRWQAIDVLEETHVYDQRQDALLNMCFDCKEFWKEEYRQIQAKHHLNWPGAPRNSPHD